MAAKPAGGHSKSIRTSILRKKQSERFSRYFLLLILIGVMVLFFTMIKMFILPVVLAAVFATLFYPLYQRVLRGLRQRRGLAAFLCCLLLLIGFLIPLYVLGNIVSHQAIEFYQNAQKEVQEIYAQGEHGPLGTFQRSSLFQKLHLERVDWVAFFKEVGGSVGAFLARLIGKTSGTALQFVLTVFITLFIMFYFFRDGQSLIARVKFFIPLNDRYIDEIIVRFATVSRATIRGTLLIGLLQSMIGAITLWIFGVGSPALWGVVMFILSLIPVVGAWLVMYPAAIIQMITGHVWQGVAIFLITVLIISTIDNLLRPRLVGHYTGMHDLMIFFAAMGGIRMFGPLGVLLGPIVAALFVTLLDIYSREFKSHLELNQQATTAPAEVVVPDRTPSPAENLP